MADKRGSILAISTGFILAFTLLGFGAVYFAGTQSQAIEKKVALSKAFWLAEAGIDKTIWEFNYHNGTTGWSPGWTTGVTRNFEGNITTLSGNEAIGDYDVNISAYDTSAPVIRSIGYVPARTGENFKRTIQVNILDNLFYSYALFANDTLEINGNLTTDSYDSSLGIYGGSNIDDNGDVGSNGDIDGSGGSYTINGDASTGESGTFTADSTQVTGTITHSNNETLSIVVVPQQLVGLPSGGTMSQGSLSAGNYKFTDIRLVASNELTITGPANIYLTNNTRSIDINSANAKIIISNFSTGPVKIYADDDVEMGGGGVINEAGIPKNFIVYGTGGSGQKVLASGTNSFYGIIYAPNAEIKLDGNFTAFGSIVGQEITAVGTVFVHHDDELSQQANESRYTVENWQEVD